MEKLFTLEEVAEQLHQNVEQLKKYVSTSNIDCFERNGVIYLSILQVEALVKSLSKTVNMFKWLEGLPKESNIVVSDGEELTYRVPLKNLLSEEE